MLLRSKPSLNNDPPELVFLVTPKSFHMAIRYGIIMAKERIQQGSNRSQRLGAESGGKQDEINSLKHIRSTLGKTAISGEKSENYFNVACHKQHDEVAVGRSRKHLTFKLL